MRLQLLRRGRQGDRRQAAMRIDSRGHLSISASAGLGFGSGGHRRRNHHSRATSSGRCRWPANRAPSHTPAWRALVAVGEEGKAHAPRGWLRSRPTSPRTGGARSARVELADHGIDLEGAVEPGAVEHLVGHRLVAELACLMTSARWVVGNSVPAGRSKLRGSGRVKLARPLPPMPSRSAWPRSSSSTSSFWALRTLKRSASPSLDLVAGEVGIGLELLAVVAQEGELDALLDLPAVARIGGLQHHVAVDLDDAAVGPRQRELHLVGRAVRRQHDVLRRPLDRLRLRRRLFQRLLLDRLLLGVGDATYPQAQQDCSRDRCEGRRSGDARTAKTKRWTTGEWLRARPCSRTPKRNIHTRRLPETSPASGLHRGISSNDRPQTARARHAALPAGRRDPAVGQFRRQAQPRGQAL